MRVTSHLAFVRKYCRITGSQRTLTGRHLFICANWILQSFHVEMHILTKYGTYMKASHE